MSCGRRKEKRVRFEGQAWVGDVLRNFKGEVLLLFSISVRVKDSNEAGVLATVEALWLFSSSFQAKLIVESDLANVLLWHLIFTLDVVGSSSISMESRRSSHIDVVFAHVLWSSNSLADGPVKHGVDRSSPWAVTCVM